jgi:hypothetical protein
MHWYGILWMDAVRAVEDVFGFLVFALIVILVVRWARRRGGHPGLWKALSGVPVIGGFFMNQLWWVVVTLDETETAERKSKREKDGADMTKASHRAVAEILWGPELLVARDEADACKKATLKAQKVMEAMENNKHLDLTDCGVEVHASPFGGGPGPQW